MGRGPCSQYSGVVHQYAYAPSAKRSTLGTMPHASPWVAAVKRLLALPAAPPSAKHCTVHNPHTWFAEAHIGGAHTLGRRQLDEGGPEACCALADDFDGANYWEFISTAHASSQAGPGVCTFFSGQPHLVDKWTNATAGVADGALAQGDFLDLYDGSCLNGWTMGNIAVAPHELTRWYEDLFVEARVLNRTSVAQMTDWKTMTTGYMPGMPYGLGLMLNQLKLPIRGRSCGTLPDCKCTGGQCVWATASIGHAGLDYGSGIPLIGYIPSLGLSFAAASNTGEQLSGANSSLTILENQDFLSSLYCQFLQIAINMALSEGAPSFACASGS